jgi:hypothetical protein
MWSPRWPLISLYLRNAGVSLAVLLKHLLFLGGHITSIKLLKNVVFNIRILLHRGDISKLWTCLVKLVCRNTSALSLYLQLARFWLASYKLTILFLQTWVGSFLFSAAGPIILLLLCWVIRILSGNLTPRVTNIWWLVPLTQNLGVILVFVELALILTCILHNLFLCRVRSALAQIIDWGTSWLVIPPNFVLLKGCQVLVLLLLEIACRLRPLIWLSLYVAGLRSLIRKILSRIFLHKSFVKLCIFVCNVVTILNYIAILLVPLVLGLCFPRDNSALFTRWLALLRLTCWQHFGFTLGRAATRKHKVMLVGV